MHNGYDTKVECHQKDKKFEMADMADDYMAKISDLKISVRRNLEGYALPPGFREEKNERA